MMKKIGSILFLDSFKKTLPNKDLSAHQRFRLFKIYTLFGLFVFAGGLYQDYMSENNNLLVIQLLYALFIAIFINYFGLSVHKKPGKAYILHLVLGFAVLHVSSYEQGGIRSSGTFYLAAIILSAFILLGKRWGKIMACISIVHVIYFYFVSLYTNWVNYSLIGTDPGMIDTDFLITGILSLTLLTAQANYIEKSKSSIIGDIQLKSDELVIKNTQLRNTQKKLEGKNKELEQKNTELEQFAYVSSHDLQEPLRTTLSFVELIQQQYHGKLDEKMDKYLDFISDASGRMNVLIKDLLDFSRIGTNVELKKVDCNSIMKDMLLDIMVTIQESKAEIQYTELPVIDGYPTEIKLLFQNLVLNAIKFRNKEIIPQIKISAQKKVDCWEFAISDNGIGIDEKHSERIFVIFQRLHTRKEYAGSGIGLSHCKKIVEMHNGNIWVESAPGAGSTFYFTIHIV